MSFERQELIQLYLDLGWPIIPLCTHDHSSMPDWHTSRCHAPGKMPLIKGWREHNVTTEENINAWSKQFKNFNVGLPLGDASGIVGIDIDGEFGEDILQDISQGDIPDTWQFSTGAGRRLLYAIPAGVKTKKNKIKGDGVHEECAFICEGQQTVIPPSVHASGQEYQWVVSPEEMDLELAPDWLLDLITLEESKHGLILNLEAVGSSIKMGDISGEFVNNALDMSMPDLSNMKTAGKKAKDKQAKANKNNGTFDADILEQEIGEGERDNTMTKIIGHFCAHNRNLGKSMVLKLSLMHNLEKCKPPLPAEAIEAKVNAFWDNETTKTQQYQAQGGGDRAPKFIAEERAQIALNAMEEEGILIKIDIENMKFFTCTKTEGPWVLQMKENPKFQAQLIKYMTSPDYNGDPSWGTESNINNYISMLCRAMASNPAYVMDASVENDVSTDDINAHPYIPMAGGELLNWKTGELHPWNPDTNLLYTLQTKYDKDATCPYWREKMSQWLPDENLQLLVQEYAGYLLVPFMGYEKMLILQGGGANGKSLFVDTLLKVIGSQNSSFLTLQQIVKEKFMRKELFGKIANLCGEADAVYLEGSSADTIKNLVSGGKVSADVKNQGALNFNNTAKMVFSTNNKIKAKDISDGWWRRLILVPFEQSFLGSTVSKSEITQNINAEIPGILNWMIEGLQRLATNGKFTESAHVQKEIASYQLEANLEMDFFTNCIEQLPVREVNGAKTSAPGIEMSVMKSLFIAWAAYREKKVQRAKNRINTYLAEELEIEVHRTKNNLRGKTNLSYLGLRINIKDEVFLDEIEEFGYDANLEKMDIITIQNMHKAV